MRASFAEYCNRVTCDAGTQTEPPEQASRVSQTEDMAFMARLYPDSETEPSAEDSDPDLQSDQWSFSARQFPGPDEPIFDSGASVTMISSNTSTPAKDEAGHDSSESEDGLAIYNPSNASSGRSQNRAAEPRASVGAIATSPSFIRSR